MADEWYFSRGSERHGPVSLEMLLAKRAAGELAASDLVWRAGMAQWAGASTVAELGFESAQPIPQGMAQPQSEPQPVVPLGTVGYSQPHHGESIVCTPRTIDLLRQTRPWARFIGVLTLIVAGLMAIGGLLFTLGMAMSRNGPRFPFAFGLIYVAMSVLYIAPGIYLMRYCSRITQVIQFRREDLLEQAIEAQKSFWKYCGIVALVVIGIYVCIFGIAMAVAIFH